MNYLALELLAAAGLEPDGHWAILASLQRTYPIVSHQPIVAAEPPAAVRAYALVQHDILFGARHLLAPAAASP